MTDDQREALEAALQKGYYAIPSEATMAEIASDLDISQQALSERLRRGHRALVEALLGEDVDGGNSLTPLVGQP